MNRLKLDEESLLNCYGQLSDLLCFDPVGLNVETPQVNKSRIVNLLTHSQSLLPTKCEKLSPTLKEPNHNGAQC